MDRVSLVVFDLAGTTIENSSHVAEAFAETLARTGVEVAMRDIAAVRGASKREAIARLIPAGPDHARRSAAGYATFTELLRRAYAEHGVRPIAGAERTMRALRARGIRVALNTGFDRQVAQPLLDALQWDAATIDATVFGDDVRAGRPAPFLIFRAMELTGVFPVHEVVNVGDTTLDLQAGYNAGVKWNVGVLSGAHTGQVLSQSPHTHLVESVVDLLPLVCDRS